MADEELLLCFVSEARDTFDDVEPKLIELAELADATGQVDPETINAVFRLFHSMKGSAGFLQLAQVSAVTHKAETLLDLFRKDSVPFRNHHADLLCRTMDLMRQLTDIIETNMTDDGLEEDVGAIVDELAAAIANAQSGSAPEEQTTSQNTSASVEAPATLPSSVLTSDLMLGDLEQLTDSFVAAGETLIGQAQHALDCLEKSPDANSEHIDAALEAIRLFNGDCRFMGKTDLESISHRTVVVLEAFRNNSAECSTANVAVLQQMIDIFQESIADIADGGKGGVAGASVMGDLLQDIASVPDKPKAPVVPAPAPSAPHVLVVDDNKEVLQIVNDALQLKNWHVTTTLSPCDALECVRAKPKAFDVLITDIRMPEMDGTVFIRKVREVAPDIPALVISGYDDKELLRDLIEIKVAGFLEKPFYISDLCNKVEAAIAEAKEKKKEPKPRQPRETTKVLRQDIRVDLAKLNTLMNLIGELVIAESMVTGNQEIMKLNLKSFKRTTRHLRRITHELQDLAMSMRMVPLSGAFQKMIRVVHDLSNKTGKKAKLIRKGEDTEVDKTVIEQIADPLLHIVRNSLDHGLETGDVRMACGKPEAGTITLEGRHEGGEVWIIIQDDGRGLDRAKILAKGIERGLVAGDGAEMSDGEVFNLIFEPGFSTSSEVTSISGRGVGMDVVKKNIEKLKGKIDIHSRTGEGTTIIMRIPLTLAIIEGMLVKVGASHYVVPLRPQTVATHRPRLWHRRGGRESSFSRLFVEAARLPG